MEDSPTGLELFLFDAQLLHGVAVEDVDAATAVYQNSGETSSSPLCCKAGIQHQVIGTRRRHHLWVISSAPIDRLLRPVHELWGSRGDSIHLSALLTPAVLVVSHAGEDDVSSVLFGKLILDCADRPDRRLLGRRRRWASRWRGQSFASSDAGEPVALPGGMIGWLHAAVELAGNVKGLLKQEGGQPGRLAALLALGAGLHFRQLVFDRRHLPAGGSRLLGLALVVARLLAPTEITSRRLRDRREHLS
jgi:hypothetical protein